MIWFHPLSTSSFSVSTKKLRHSPFAFSLFFLTRATPHRSGSGPSRLSTTVPSVESAPSHHACVIPPRSFELEQRHHAATAIMPNALPGEAVPSRPFCAVADGPCRANPSVPPRWSMSGGSFLATVGQASRRGSVTQGHANLPAQPPVMRGMCLLQPWLPWPSSMLCV
jgi:hypothetical protein